MTLLFYFGAVSGLKRMQPQYRPMRQGSGEELEQAGSGGNTGEHEEIFLGLWVTTYLGVTIQVPWTIPDGIIG